MLLDKVCTKALFATLDLALVRCYSPGRERTVGAKENKPTKSEQELLILRFKELIYAQYEKFILLNDF